METAAASEEGLEIVTPDKSLEKNVSAEALWIELLTWMDH
jgi:hypothetical protein